MIYFLFVLLMIVSITIIWTLVWYSKKVTFQLSQFTLDMESLLQILVQYSNRLKEIHEMELFYGEPIIQDLINHTNFIVDKTQQFKEMYTVVSNEEMLSLEETIEDEEKFAKERDK